MRFLVLAACLVAAVAGGRYAPAAPSPVYGVPNYEEEIEEAPAPVYNAPKIEEPASFPYKYEIIRKPVQYIAAAPVTRVYKYEAVPTISYVAPEPIKIVKTYTAPVASSSYSYVAPAPVKYEYVKSYVAPAPVYSTPKIAYYTYKAPAPVAREIPLAPHTRYGLPN